MLLSALLLAVASAPAYAGQSGTARSAAPPPLGGVFHPIASTGTGMCLEPAGQSTAELAAIVQQRCVRTGQESLAQGWKTIKVGTNHYQFLNQLSGFCFDAFDGAFNGARLLQGTCVPISNEEFNTGKPLPAFTKIESRERFRDTHFCVDVPGNQRIPGLAVQLFTCNGTPAQTWQIDFF
jgi:hypothetical protein